MVSTYVTGEIAVPRLPGWVTFDEAAELLIMSRQGVWNLVFRYGEFTVTDDPATSDVTYMGVRPLLMLRESAVHAKRRERDAAGLTSTKRVTPRTDAA